MVKNVQKNVQNGCPLEFFSYCFLAFPVLVFFLNWLVPMFSIIASCLLLVVLYNMWRGSSSSSSAFSWKFLDFKAVILPAIVWTLLSGAGGIFFQREDWIKHNSILLHLSVSAWPVILPGAETHTGSIYLLYYFAFYLPSALIGRIAGIEGASFALFGWTLIGVVLSMLWYTRLVGQSIWKSITLFVFFGGMSFLGQIMSKGGLPAGNADMDLWAGVWQYHGNTASLFSAPQHTLVGWIASALIFYEGWERRRASNLLAIWSITPFWSPFITLGLTPFLCLAIWQNARRDVLSLQNMLSIVFLGIAGIFFSANLAVSGAERHSGWVWTKLNLYEQWPLLVIFYTVNFGLYAALAWRPLMGGCNNSTWRLWLLTIITLLFVPLYTTGKLTPPEETANDFCVRVSVPAFYILSIFLGRTLLQNPLPVSYKLQTHCLLACLSIGMLGAVAQVSGTIENTPGFQATYDPIWNQPYRFRHQYYGNRNSWLFKALFK